MFQATCETPRDGIDPGTGALFPDIEGTPEHEKLWLRSWTHELYLWYRDVPDPDPATYPTALDYFDVLRTPDLTPSGRPKDQFHFTYATEDWQALSQSGLAAGYGATFSITASMPPRQVVVAYNEPGSAAADANLDRGAEILTIDGVSVIDGNDVDTLNAGLLPASVGETHTFVVRDLGAIEAREITLTSASVESVPVQKVMALETTDGPVGYMVFNDHIATAEPALLDAVTDLADAGITDLVLDMRYNGGGFLDIASELAYEIAGPDATRGQTFEQVAFNDQYPGIDPFSGQPIEPLPFHDRTTPGIATPTGDVPLPSLSLPRVFILTGPATCSASEAVMNGLRGIDVEVIQIGTTTCGKPYGFFPTDNCGTTYFSIQFQGVNAKGFGDYADGFTPAADGEAGLPGCPVEDDFTHALGDPDEARLAAALYYRENGACPTAARRDAGRTLSAVDGRVAKSIWQQNRILVR
ncbi:MAG TPA: S41 family peptidase [Kofleriaceae bacterium]|nr:S41 family peptidase [Kofleriaceae bacterium]